jgi:hypothetical protein
MKLKRFNESNNLDSIVNEFKEKLEKFKFTNEDILYYFSQFTDEYEYEYNLILSGWDQGYDIDTVIKRKMLEVRISFNKKYPTEDKILNAIQLGDELKKFMSNFNQFKEIEEDIKNIVLDLSNSKNEVKIMLSFSKIIPQDIIDDYVKKYNDVKEVKKSLYKRENNYGISRSEIDSIISDIDTSDIISHVGTDSDDIDVDFEYEVDMDDNGDRIITFYPIILTDGEINDDLTASVGDLEFNYDTGELFYKGIWIGDIR